MIVEVTKTSIPSSETGLDFDWDGHFGFTVGYNWIKTGRQVLKVYTYFLPPVIHQQN